MPTAHFDRRSSFLDIDWKLIASICAVLVFVGSIIGYLAKNSQADTNAVQDKSIALLQQSDATQNASILEMKSNIEYLRRSAEEQNKRQGIVIEQLPGAITTVKK